MMSKELIEAAQALVDRWDGPLWKDAEHTRAYIARLRRALDEPVEPSQDVEAFIKSAAVLEYDSVFTDDLRDWMAGHVRVKIPIAMEMEPFQTIDKASKNYKAGWNACRASLLTASKESTK